jgi:7,8-dihydropterin-6-yl-methyl-4-(beta-D-ribofuranosyl)aminobenzene 5'-phosphate synthase
VDQVVLSHEHGDHTLGLFSVLPKKPNIPVYVPVSFTEGFVQKTEAAGGKIVRVDEPVELCKDVHLTGEMTGRANEISLILDTSKGLVVITGCAHPGIVDIVKKAKEIQDKDVYLVFGGFHLLDKSEIEIEEIIHQFKELGVEKCGATHCTGDKAIEMFRKAYGDNYVGMGVGKIVKIAK